MEKVKEMPKAKENGVKEKPSKADLIKQAEQNVEKAKNDFHYWSGYLASLKENN